MKMNVFATGLCIHQIILFDTRYATGCYNSKAVNAHVWHQHTDVFGGDLTVFTRVRFDSWDKNCLNYEMESPHFS